MDFKTYQKKARKHAFYPNKGKFEALTYLTLGLVGEAGEVAEHLKHIIRDEKGNMSKKAKDLLIKELGDVLWYISSLSSELKITIERVAKDNIDKIESRKSRGTLKGRGDER